MADGEHTWISPVSAMRTRTPRTGLPTVSILVSSSGLHAITGSSVVPYAVSHRIPARAVMSSATLRVTGVAHHITNRSDDRSNRSRPGCAASARAMGATAISIVMPSDSM